MLWEVGDHWGVTLAVLNLGHVAALQGEPPRVVRLLGTAMAAYRVIGYPIPAGEHARSEQRLEELRARVGEPGYVAAWTTGQALSLEQAIEEALAAGPATEPAGRRGTHAGLSAREQEVAALIAQRFTSREIAERLVVSERTVDAHAEHIRTKLGLRSRAEIATWATKHGLRDDG